MNKDNRRSVVLAINHLENTYNFMLPDEREKLENIIKELKELGE